MLAPAPWDESASDALTVLRAVLRDESFVRTGKISHKISQGARFSCDSNHTALISLSNYHFVQGRGHRPPTPATLPEYITPSGGLILPEGDFDCLMARNGRVKNHERSIGFPFAGKSPIARIIRFQAASKGKTITSRCNLGKIVRQTELLGKYLIMPTSSTVLIFGASYGSLLAAKLLLAGHSVKLVCLPDEAELINREGIRVRMPVRGEDDLIEIDSRRAPGVLTAAPPDAVDAHGFDLAALAMQEPQYGSPGVRGLLEAVAKAGIPCMSIMNMPPLPYLNRIPGLDTGALTHCYTDPTVWAGFDPALVTLCSPDPQAFRPPEEKTNVLQVALPTNFKAARFESRDHTAMLRRMQADIEAIRFETAGRAIELPVKLKVHDSVFVPLAKWSMLLTGNYRCIQKDGMRSIRDAVHGDIDQSRAIYEWVGELCQALGAAPGDLVPFEKYAKAAEGLVKPSSAARALFGGAANIERVDSLVKAIAAQKGMRSDAIDETVALVDHWLGKNR